MSWDCLQKKIMRNVNFMDSWNQLLMDPRNQLSKIFNVLIQSHDY